MKREGYEYFDVALAVGVAAWGEDLPGCLRQCALGVFNLIVPTESVRPIESREVAARGGSVDALLVSWLDECLYVHDLEGFVVADVTPPEVTATGMHALLRGESADPSRHPPGAVVKVTAVLDVTEVPGRVSVQIVLST